MRRLKPTGWVTTVTAANKNGTVRTYPVYRYTEGKLTKTISLRRSQIASVEKAIYDRQSVQNILEMLGKGDRVSTSGVAA